MKSKYVLFFYVFIFFSCSKKQKEIKDMHIQEPDFSEMIRKSDSARKNAILQRSQGNSKEVLKKELPIEVSKKEAQKLVLKEEKAKEVIIETSEKVIIKIIKPKPKKIIKKTPKPIVKKKTINTSGLIYTVQIAALDYEDKKYNAIKNVIKYNENSLVKYGLGSFKTFNEAQKYRSKIINKYKGAFVKALRNKVPVSIK